MVFGGLNDEMDLSKKFQNRLLRHDEKVASDRHDQTHRLQKRWDRPCFTQTKYFAFSAHLMVPFTYRLKVLTFEKSQKYFGFLLT